MGSSSSWRGAWVALIFASILAPSAAMSCMVASSAPPLWDSKTYVESERAVIIWDEKTHTEHFIREADIRTHSEDIGFLVPSPTVPEIASASSGIFDMAEKLMPNPRTASVKSDSPWTMVAPVVENPLLHLGRLSPVTLFGSAGQPQAQSGPLLQKAVNGMLEASVFDAKDAVGLSKWLADRKYACTPEMQVWLASYGQKDWKITAFQFHKKFGYDGPVMTTSVRLSFHTDRPFYPYSEPSDRQAVTAMSPNGRVLELTVLGNERMRAEASDGSKWPGALEFASHFQGPDSAANAENLHNWNGSAGLKSDAMEAMNPTWSTTFADISNPRPGTTDVYFVPDADQAEVKTVASIDLSAESSHQLAVLHPLADAGAVLAIFLLPLVPIYCGWEVLRIRTEVKPGTLPLVQATLGRWNYFVGIFAVAIALFYSAQYALLVFELTISALRGWEILDWTFAWQYGVIVLAAVPIAALAWGVMACGIQIVRMASPSGRTAVSDELSRSDIVRRSYMGAFSLIAGGVFFLAMVEFVLPHLWAG